MMGAMEGNLTFWTSVGRRHGSLVMRTSPVMISDSAPFTVIRLDCELLKKSWFGSKIPIGSGVVHYLRLTQIHNWTHREWSKHLRTVVSQCGSFQWHGWCFFPPLRTFSPGVFHSLTDGTQSQGKIWWSPQAKMGNRWLRPATIPRSAQSHPRTPGHLHLHLAPLLWYYAQYNH